MADRAVRRPVATRLRSPLWRLTVVTAGLGALAGCGGQSTGAQVAAVVNSYNRAFAAGRGQAVCALMTARLRHELIASPGVSTSGVSTSSSCAQFVAFVNASVRDSSSLHPSVTAVRVRGGRATATVRSRAGLATLPLSRDAGGWRVAGPLHYVSRTWLQADYRVRNAAGLSASSIAGILAQRARTIVGTLAHAGTIGRDEVRVTVAEPVGLADLGLVTRHDRGRLAFYDWEADAFTPAGRRVSDALRKADRAAMLISQGSGTEPPGATGGLPQRAARKLAAAHHRAAVVAAGPPSRAAIAAGEDPGARYFVLRHRSALSRSDVTSAYAIFGQYGQPEIVLQFTSRGAVAFQRLTAQIARRGAALSTPSSRLNQHLAAVLDGKLLSVVYVDFARYPHGIPSGDGMDIHGGFTIRAAQRLASEIAAPPLPADLELIHATTLDRRG